jgi:NTP pyrophosphatase (non-canonical NTP hydrolase)
MNDSPINTLQQLMCITMEECGELTQRCSKMMRKFETIDDTTEDQRVKLLEEAGDVLCMIELMVENGLLTNEELGVRVNYKRNKLKTWSTLIKDEL